MSGLVIDAERCIGCKRCIRACAFGGIEVRDRLAHPTEACTLCGSCVDACPVGALAIERPEVTGSGAREDALGAEGLAAYHDIWVVAQRDAFGRVLPVTLELVAKARELACERGCDVVAVLAEGASKPVAVLAEEASEPVAAPGLSSALQPASTTADVLLAAGADAVLRCRDERLAAQDPEVMAAWLAALARERLPEVVLMGATALGREVAPRVAVQLQTGLTADCTELALDPATGLLQQTRPAFGGNLMATIECPAHRPQMATVRPGVFAGLAQRGASSAGGGSAVGCNAREGKIEDVVLAFDIVPRVRVIEREEAAAGSSIAQAKRLVVVGRGIGGKKNLALAGRLAELLGAELGCTRPLVEAGWLDYAHQVGQTGASVAPEFLLSLGVSGAIQHVAGIGGAQTIIAVNDDPAAPIFGVTQYRVVADCVAFARELVRQLEGRG